MTERTALAPSSRVDSVEDVSSSTASPLNQDLSPSIPRPLTPSGLLSQPGQDIFPLAKNFRTMERERVDSRLRGFNPHESVAWADIRRRFGDSLNQAELRSLAEVIGSEVGIKVDREAKRRKEVLIKWFDENYGVIQGVLGKIEMEETDGESWGQGHDQDFEGHDRCRTVQSARPQCPPGTG
jgi:hypothetical protein